MNQHSSRENTNWVGVDVSKEVFDASLVLAHEHYPATSLKQIPADTFQRTREGILQFLAWLDGFELESEEVRVVMEATGNYSTELAVWLLEARASLRPAIANPHYTSAFIKSMGVRNKTDKLEARALGFYGVERQPMAYEPPTKERAELRDLSRWRDYLVAERTRLKNKGKETSGSTEVSKMLDRRLRQLIKDIQKVETQMKKLVDAHEDLKNDIDLLCTIYGIAFINATMILAELGDLRRFEHARQLTAFAGMSPRHRQSGTSIHGKSTLCKQGNPRVRQGLYLSAMCAIRGNNPFRATYQKLLDQGKPKMVALAAIMRKLLVLMRAILISEKPYNPMGITKA